MMCLLAPLQNAFAEHFTVQEQQAIKNMREFSRKGQWQAVYKTADWLGDPVILRFFDWLRFIDGTAPKSFDELTYFATKHYYWPRQNILRKAIERKARTEKVPAEKIIGWYERYPPVTVEGAVHYLKTLIDSNRELHAGKEARSLWVRLDFTPKQQNNFYKVFGTYLTQKDHLARVERLMWEDKRGGAKRMKALLSDDNKAFYTAWNTMVRAPRYFKEKYNKLSKVQKKHLAFRLYFIKKYRRQDRDIKARELLLTLPADVPYPSKWWGERERQIRRAIAKKDFKSAYDLASTHKQKSGASRALAEFLAGWLELRFMDKADEAATRFVTLFGQVTTAVSRARAAYWAGRSYEAMNEGTRASYWYKQAGQYTGTFYAQQALLRLGESELPYISVQYPLNETVKERFLQRELVRALDILKVLDDPNLSRSFFVELFDATVNYDELKILLERARSFDNKSLMRLATSKAARKGLMSIEDMFPVLEKMRIRRDVEPALVHAIIHQESRFKTRAVSKAGARGLMQITPSTARLVARKNNIRRHSTRRLTRDPKHNIRLGTAYLDTLSQRLNGSYVLMLAAYNAGPSNAAKWVAQHGMPNHKNPDEVLDWMEMIPFRETRNYVQRVLEKLTVYRHMLTVWNGHKAPKDPKHLVKKWCVFFCD